MKRKFIIRKITEEAHVAVSYADGELTDISFSGMSRDSRAAFLAKAPLTMEGPYGLDWWHTNTWVQVTEVPVDLTFESFWAAYGNKVGNKTRAKKLWNLLDDDTRAAAYAGISRYNSYLAAHPAIEKCYPETYLNQRRWEN